MRSTSKLKTASLNAKTNRLVIIIDPPKNMPLSACLDWLKACRINLTTAYSQTGLIATIIHDRDVNEDGTAKLPHLHAFVETLEETTLSHRLKEVCEITGATKEQVSIDTSNSDFLQVQYLTHKNQPQKAQYPYEDIETNKPEELHQRYYQEYQEPVDPIKEALLSSQTLLQLVQTIGYQKANQLRGLFKDLHAENSLIANFHKLETDYLAIKQFATELMTELNLHLSGNESRLTNWRYWQEYADKLDLYF